MNGKKNILRVGTYNVGDYSGENLPAGSEKAKGLFREVIESDGVELWGLQEDVGFFNADTEETTYDAVYSSYKNYKRCGVKKYNYKAFLTNLPISDAEQIYYVGDCKFYHPWFLHAQLEFAGKDICVITLHFDWQDRETREKQIKQVIEFASKYEYSMIIGDFNPCDCVNIERQSENSTHEYDLAIFRKAGFNVANADKFGTFTTHVGHKEITDYPCDNIVVSSNIKIHNAGIIVRDWMNDHAALWADVELC